jgi:hypothetical protein
MKRRWRERALAAIVAALMPAFTVPLRRAEPLPRLPPMMALVAMTRDAPRALLA